MNIDLDKLYAKSKCFGDSLQQRRKAVQKIKQLNRTRITQTNAQIRANQNDRDISRQTKLGFGGTKAQSEQKLQVRGRAAIIYIEKQEPAQKNPGVSDVDKMMFQKKFKNYLNHREQFRELARNRREKIIKQRKAKAKLQPGQDYFNEEQVLSNTDSDYQYEDATDMLEAYQEIATGKRKKKGGVKLFHAQKIEYALRISEFENLLLIQQSQSLISKNLLLNYLFEEPCIMMLYSINPYSLADEISDLQTNAQQMLNFEQFSQFLLIDRQPTYFQYSAQNLQQAKQIGRGLKCAPIVGKWIGDQQIKQWILQIFRNIDLFGSLQVDREVFAKKLTKQAQQKRLLDEEVIQIVNIGKKLPLRRLIYEIEYEEGQRQYWPLGEFTEFLENYHRLETPPKDKLIMKLIMAGKFDPSYVYVVSAEVLEIVKDVFSQTQKFAQCYVLKQKFIQKLVLDSRYKRIKSLLVRSQGNRFVDKQTVQQTLIRMHTEADNYIDIEEILDFFTNRGRPNIVQYQVYIANLQSQLRIIQEEQRLRQQRQSEGAISSSDQQYSNQLKQRRVNRKKQKLASIQKGNNYKKGKKFNVTIPLNFNFDTRQKKVTIRQQKVTQMLEDKKRKQDESMAQFKAKPVPNHVKQSLYKRMMDEQQRQRQQRLERFKLQIEKMMVPMPEHLIAPKRIPPHRDIENDRYKFVARIMPWYCQVNLLKRINQKKQQRRQQILQAIINRNNDFDLPFGVQQMLQRHDQLEEKRKIQKGTAATISDSLTFVPKITQRVPDFHTLHQQFKIDLQIAKQNKVPIRSQPFSFQNRPKKIRTTHDKPKKQHLRSLSRQRPAQEDDINIPVTRKYQAMVELRREQAQKKQIEKEQEQRANQIRKMRKQKFAPYVRAVLRKKDNELGRSREQIEQKMRQFKKSQRNKKDEYEKQMIKIYTKVFNRPLLVESTGQFGQNQMKRISKYSEEQVADRGLQSRDQQREKHAKERYDKEYDRRRQQVIEQQPGQYPVEQHYEDDERYGENDFEEQFMSDSQGGNYTN